MPTIPVVNPPRAKITKNSVRIIIDIPDVTNFDWDRAHSLWKENFKESDVGTAARNATNGRMLGYFWCKVNPRTNKPIASRIITTDNMMPMPNATMSARETEDLDAAFQEFYMKLEQLETTIRRLKTSNDPKVAVTASDRSELINDVALIRCNVKAYKEMLA
jgi:hypothetical protein